MWDMPFWLAVYRQRNGNLRRPSGHDFVLVHLFYQLPRNEDGGH